MDELIALLNAASSSRTFVLVLAGAGASVDSNLSSYAQVDESEWLKSRGLSYRDVSSPDLLATNAVLFNAWTEKCIATYRAATPHEGYAALLRLRDAMNRDPSNAALVAELHAAMRDGVRAADLPRDALPGRMFVATTNVDSMFLKAGFDECDVYHMHGRYERVQCSALHDGSASSWRRFDAAPCRNETWLLDAAWKPTGGAPPTCKWCQRPSRPAVYLFGDSVFLGPTQEEAQFLCWRDGVQRLLRSTSDTRLIVLEIGVGLRLPRLRVVSREIRHAVGQCASQVLRFRINDAVETPNANDADVRLISLGACDALSRAINNN